LKGFRRARKLRLVPGEQTSGRIDQPGDFVDLADTAPVVAEAAAFQKEERWKYHEQTEHAWGVAREPHPGGG
jgi:hypothetical protein